VAGRLKHPLELAGGFLSMQNIKPSYVDEGIAVFSSTNASEAKLCACRFVLAFAVSESVPRDRKAEMGWVAQAPPLG
jgi:hypothetical protein